MRLLGREGEREREREREVVVVVVVGGSFGFYIICTFGSFIPSVCASLLPALTFL